MSITIAEADVRVTSKGGGKSVAREIVGDVGRAEGAEGAGSNIGRKVFAGIVGAVAALGIGKAIGSFLTAGFQRLEAIDNARAKLRGLGHDAGVVDGIMNDALASVRGTAFGLDAAATVAATAVAAGIEPGTRLQRTLTLVADTATIAGSSLEEMGSIFNKVAASNRLSMEEVNQLLDRGIPILSALGDQLGIAQGEVRDFVSEGKIDFETFQAALESALGGAAQSGGETFSGAMANVRAALSRVSAGLLQGVFPQLVPLLQGIIDALGPLEEGAKGVGAAFGERMRPAFEWAANWIKNLDLTPIRDWFGEFRDGAQMVVDFLTPAWEELVGVFRDEVMPRLEDLGDWFGENGQLIGSIATGVSVMAVAWGAAALGVGLFTAAMNALKVALVSHPIGWVLLIIGGIVGGLVWLEQETRVFSNAWQWMVDNVLPVWQEMWEELEPAFERLGEAFGEVWEALDPVFTLIEDAVDDLREAWLLGFGIAVAWFVDEAVPVIVDFIENRLVPAIIIFADTVSWMLTNVVVPAIQYAIIGFNWLWTNIVDPIWQRVQPAIMLLGSIILWLWTNIISPVLGFIVQRFAWWGENVTLPILRRVMPALQTLGAYLGWLWTNVVSPVLGFIASRFQWWGGVIGGVLTALVTGANVVVNAWRSGFGQIANIVGNAFQSALNRARGPINSMIALVNRAIGAINGISITIPAFVPGIGGETFSPSLPTIPMLARGTNNAPDVFIAGENGPELITGANGATVTPYSETRDQLRNGRGGDVFQIENVTLDVSKIEDLQRFADMLRALPDVARAGSGRGMGR